MGLIAEIFLPDKKTTKLRIAGNAIFSCFFAYGVVVNQSYYAVLLLAFCALPLAIDLVRVRKFKSYQGEIGM
ncbi:MAG: hypothetical protein JRD68_01075 [Deltaproteobacteria bacterium]|nr:hypothetical protein [Deltaproteobacteria bacterium]